MSSLHLIGGEKGGVGKSFTARLLAQYFVDRELPFIGRAIYAAADPLAAVKHITETIAQYL